VIKTTLNYTSSDPHEFPNTEAFTVCENSDFSTRDLMQYGIKTKENHGLSYVQTGQGVFVTLFSSNDMLGQTMVIHPSQVLFFLIFPVCLFITF